jgi:hypothetical protein
MDESVGLNAAGLNYIMKKKAPRQTHGDLDLRADSVNPTLALNIHIHRYLGHATWLSLSALLIYDKYTFCQTFDV